MKRKALAIPEIALISGTRAALGAGLALLLGGGLKDSQRKAVGWTLFGVGVLTTIPIVMQLLASEPEDEEEMMETEPEVEPHFTPAGE